MSITIRATLGLALIAVGSSCFSPNREEGLTCSSEGLCPGSQVCDTDNICRDSFLNDAGTAPKSDATNLIDASELPDGPDGGLVFDLVPDGLDFVSLTVGLSFVGEAFGEIKCGEGEVMYGVEADAFSMGLCKFKARCGRLSVTGEAAVATLDPNGTTIPSGIGIGDCLAGGPISAAHCPMDSVVSGITAVSTGVNALPQLTELILQCSPISVDGSVEMSVDGDALGGLGFPELVRDNAFCGPNRVAVGVRGTADATLGSLNLICRRLIAVE